LRTHFSIRVQHDGREWTVERRFEEFQHLDKQLRRQQTRMPPAISKDRKRDVLRRCTSEMPLDPRMANLDSYLFALPDSIPCLENVSELATFLGTTETAAARSTDMIQTTSATEAQDEAEDDDYELPRLSDAEPEFPHLEPEQQVAQSELPTLLVHQSTHIYNELPLSSDDAFQHGTSHQEQQQGLALLSFTSDKCEKIGAEFPNITSSDTKFEAVQPEAQNLPELEEDQICRPNEQFQNSEQALVSARDECAAYKELVNVLQSEKDQADKLPKLEASKEVEQESQSRSVKGLVMWWSSGATPGLGSCRGEYERTNRTRSQYQGVGLAGV